MKLSLLPLVKRTFDEQFYKVTVEKEKIRLTSNKRDGRPSKPLVLPKILDINEEFITGFGIFYSEGTWAIGGVSRVEAGNSEPILLNHFINFLEDFGFKKTEFKVKIGIYEEDAAIKEPEKLKNFWKQKLLIPLENFQKVSFYKKTGSKRVAMKYGVAQVRYYNTNLVRFMHAFRKEMLRIIGNNKKLTKAFLKGVIASEGHVELRNASSLKAVYIACKNTHDELLGLLSSIGIQTKGYKIYNRCIRIQGVKNFKILFNDSLMNVHPDKNSEFINGLKNHRYVFQVIPSRRFS